MTIGLVTTFFRRIPYILWPLGILDDHPVRVQPGHSLQHWYSIPRFHKFIPPENVRSSWYAQSDISFQMFDYHGQINQMAKEYSSVSYCLHHMLSFPMSDRKSRFLSAFFPFHSSRRVLSLSNFSAESWISLAIISNSIPRDACGRTFIFSILYGRTHFFAQPLHDNLGLCGTCLFCRRHHNVVV